MNTKDQCTICGFVEDEDDAIKIALNTKKPYEENFVELPSVEPLE